MQLGSCWFNKNVTHRGISISVIQATVPVSMSGTLVCTVPKEGDVISGLLHQDMRPRLSEENVAVVSQAVPAEQPVLCHHKATLWH